MFTHTYVYIITWYIYTYVWVNIGQHSVLQCVAVCCGYISYITHSDYIGYLIACDIYIHVWVNIVYTNMDIWSPVIFVYICMSKYSIYIYGYITTIHIWIYNHLWYLYIYVWVNIVCKCIPLMSKIDRSAFWAQLSKNNLLAPMNKSVRGGYN